MSEESGPPATSYPTPPSRTAGALAPASSGAVSERSSPASRRPPKPQLRLNVPQDPSPFQPGWGDNRMRPARPLGAQSPNPAASAGANSGDPLPKSFITRAELARYYQDQTGNQLSERAFSPPKPDRAKGSSTERGARSHRGQTPFKGHNQTSPPPYAMVKPRPLKSNKAAAPASNGPLGWFFGAPAPAPARSSPSRRGAGGPRGADEAKQSLLQAGTTSNSAPTRVSLRGNKGTGKKKKPWGKCCWCFPKWCCSCCFPKKWCCCCWCVGS